MDHLNYYSRSKSSTSSSTESDSYHYTQNDRNMSNEINRTISMDIDRNTIRYRKDHLRLQLNIKPEFKSKSEEYLPGNSVSYKRNISHVQLFQRNEDGSPKSGKTIMTKFKSAHTETCTTPTTETDSDDVELRKTKRVNFRRVVSQSIRGSFKLVRRMRPKSDSDVCVEDKHSKPEQFRRIRKFAALLVNNQQFSLQPPAPLVVEDPPSTDEELNDIRNQNPALLNGDNITTRPPIRKQHSVACMTDPAMICFVQGFETRVGDNGKLHTVRNKLLRKSRSSGNFGSAGPRSAPSTPQGQLGAPQGLSEPLAIPIQRSPSHSVFTKVDKTSLKHLSSSTPAMTAQGQLAEPPSPKAAKDPKVHTTSKARQKKFLRHFPNVEEDEKVLNHYSCALIGDILLQGHLYITKNYFAFYSNVFGYVTKLLIPILTVEEITKEKTARIIPNAVGIATSEDKHIFGSLMSRDSTLAYMRTVWEKAKSEEALPEPEITEPDQDSSESGESGRESPPLESVPSGSEVLASAKFDRIKKETIRNQSEASLLERKGSRGFVRTLKDAISEFRKLPRQSLILVATTLLLILLFLSAAVLLYRINKIQNKYSMSLQGATLSSTSNDIYGDILQWQTHLHSKSADAVNNFLDNNLDQIAKVRQSLEALSTLLMGQNQNPTDDSGATPAQTADTQTEAEPASTNMVNNDS